MYRTSEPRTSRPVEPGPARAGRNPNGRSPGGRSPGGRGRTGHRGPIWAKLLVGVGALVMLAGLGAITFVNVTLGQINGAVRSGNLLGQGGGAHNTLSGSEIKGPINILLLGVDTRPTGDNGSHSDSMIIAHIPASHDRVYLISIPRDTGVRAPADDKTHFPGGSHKLTDVFSFGSRDGAGNEAGFQLIAATIKLTWGISFNGAAIVDFNGFTDIINKLGGVDMVVDETTVSIHHGYYTDNPSKHAAPFNINPETGVPICSHGLIFTVADAQRCAKPGITPKIYYKNPKPQHLSPYDALDFVRCRDGLAGTDYGRQRHQQQFIKAVMQEAFDKGLSDPLKMQSFVTSIGKAFIFDRNGVSLTDWIFTLKGLTPSAMVTIKTNNGQYVRYDGALGPIPGSVQGLNSDSQALLAAVRGDRAGTDLVGQWLSTHSDWASG